MKRFCIGGLAVMSMRGLKVAHFCGLPCAVQPKTSQIVQLQTRSGAAKSPGFQTKLRAELASFKLPGDITRDRLLKTLLDMLSVWWSGARYAIRQFDRLDWRRYFTCPKIVLTFTRVDPSTLCAPSGGFP